MTSNFRYITTPIYYASGTAHAGHFYATLLADILGTHYKHREFKTLTLTGMDEHGEKIAEKAASENKTPQVLVDELAVQWKKAFAEFQLHSDIFIRTTSTEHVANVQEILNACFKNGDIYFGEHEGHYCVACEAFLTAKEQDEHGNCLIHKRKTELRREGNYYFRTSKYIPEIIAQLKQGNIIPNSRFANEAIAIAEALEGDLSISRPKTRTQWGIELPFDSKHVAYVWFDALPNYVTGIGGVEAARTSPMWKNAVHVIGKDILKFHAIYWPAMLLSLKLPLPTLLVTGWLHSSGHKMSKSLGNVIGLSDLQSGALAEYGRDAFTNTVFRLINPGDDLDITIPLLLERFNADLANGIGNLLSRTLGLIEKNFQNTIPSFSPALDTSRENELCAVMESLAQRVENSFDQFKLADALAAIWDLISKTDKYIAETKPWELAKNQTPEGKAQLGNILAQSVAVLRIVALVSASFFPEKMDTLLLSLGEAPASSGNAFQRARKIRNINAGFVFSEIPKLFSRIDIKAELASRQSSEPKDDTISENKISTPKMNGDKTTVASKTIAIDDFTKVEIHIGTVMQAELVDGSDKLLRLQISLGDLGQRQVFSGIRQWVKPEDIAGRKVLVVTNLAPRKMKFGMSEGMVLSTDTQDGQVSPVYAPEGLKEGSRLS